LNVFYFITCQTCHVKAEKQVRNEHDTFLIDVNIDFTHFRFWTECLENNQYFYFFTSIFKGLYKM